MAEWLKHDQGLIAEECLTHWSAPTGLLIESFLEPHKQGLTHNYMFWLWQELKDFVCPSF